MDFNRLTIKSQEALQKAQSLAIEHGHGDVGVEHLALTLVRQQDGLPFTAEED